MTARPRPPGHPAVLKTSTDLPQTARSATSRSQERNLNTVENQNQNNNENRNGGPEPREHRPGVDVGAIFHGLWAEGNRRRLVLRHQGETVLRLPMTIEPTSPAMPALMCTTVPPAKSSAPIWKIRPAPSQTMCATGR